MKIIIFLSIILLLSGCIRDQKGDESYHFTIIPVMSPDENIFSLSSLSDNFTYVRLETNDSCLIKDIKKIFYLDDEIIIGSDNSILFFDKTGAFKHFINRQGAGPEEYIRLSDFDICPDRRIITILDTRKKSILEYDLSGNFKRKIELNNWHIGLNLLNDSVCLLYSGNQISEGNKNKFISYNLRTPSLTDGFYPIPEWKSKYLHIHIKNNFSGTENEMLFFELYNDTIYQVSSSEYTPLYYLDFGKDKIPSSFWNNSYENIMEFQQELSKHDVSYGVSSLANTPRGFFASYFDHSKRCFLFYDKIANHCLPFRQFTDSKLLDNFVIDAIKYNVSFYSDKNYLFTIADNELYIDGKEYLVDSALKNQLGNIAIDDNPIIRICKIDH